MSAFDTLWYDLWETISLTSAHDARLILEDTSSLLLETGDFLLLE